MAGYNGTELTIDYASTTLTGVKAKTVTVNNELVDVTTDDDGGFATYLPKPGKRSLTGSVSGITSDEVIIAAIMNASNVGGTLAVNMPSNLASPGDLSGTLLWQSIEFTTADDGSVEFSANFVSTGAFTYTASSA